MRHERGHNTRVTIWGASMIVVSSLQCGFPGSLVVDVGSFEVDDGEVVAIRGPNGVGKSTLLATVAGYLQPLSGCASVNGASRSEARAQTAYAPAYDLTMNDTTAAGQLRRIEKILPDGEAWAPGEPLANLVVMEFGNVRCTWLSSGQRRLLSLATVLRAPAGAVVLDEPFNFLSAEWKAVVWRSVYECAAANVPVLIATHTEDPQTGPVPVRTIELLAERKS